MNKHHGFFLSLEGCEGVGKSTAMHAIADHLSTQGKACVLTREPGGTALAELLRDLVLKPTIAEDIDIKTEVLLVFAARAQHVTQVIKPALAAGKMVICDRFTDASFAYQGQGRGLDRSIIQWLADFVHPHLWPDLTLLLDAPLSVALSRMDSRGSRDRIEQEKTAFFEKVRACYRQRANDNPERFRLIDATQTIDEVRQQVIHCVDNAMSTGIR